MEAETAKGLVSTTFILDPYGVTQKEFSIASIKKLLPVTIGSKERSPLEWLQEVAEAIPPSSPEDCKMLEFLDQVFAVNMDEYRNLEILLPTPQGETVH